ncbi:MAG: DUF945 family protein, partial [Dehalococcoidia bacterium]
MVTLTGLAIVLLIACGMAARWAGVQAEQQMLALFAEIESGADIGMDGLTYDRGWFSSDARYAVTLPLGAGALTARVHDRIDHGPLFFTNGVDTGLANIHSRVRFNAKETPAVTGHTRIALDGSSISRFHLTPLNVALTTAGGGRQVQLTADSGSAEIRYDGPRGRLEAKARLASLILMDADNNERITLAELHMQQSVAQTGRRLWLGEGLLEIASLKVTGPDIDTLTITGLKLSGSSSPDGPVFNGRIAMDLDQITTDVMQLGPGRLRLSFDRIDIDAWSRLTMLLEEIETAADRNDALARLLLSDGFDLLQQFSRRGPGITIDELFLDLQDAGMLEASARVNYPEQMQINAFNPLAALNALNAELNLAIPLRVAQHWFQQSAIEQLDTYQRDTGDLFTDEEYDKLREDKVREAVRELSLNPLVTVDDERIRTRIVLDTGMVIVNDVPVASLLNLLMPWTCAAHVACR